VQRPVHVRLVAKPGLCCHHAETLLLLCHSLDSPRHKDLPTIYARRHTIVAAKRSPHVSAIDPGFRRQRPDSDLIRRFVYLPTHGFNPPRDF
jgi:hypothetical protein